MQAFHDKYIGKPWDYDNHYGYQCVDLFRFYLRELGLNLTFGVQYAYQLFDRAPTSYFEKLTSDPRSGDVGIWPATKGNVAGHVAMILDILPGGRMTIIEQDGLGKVRMPNGTFQAGSVAKVRTVPIAGTRFLRPKVLNSMANILPPQKTVYYYQTIANRDPESEAAKHGREEIGLLVGLGIEMRDRYYREVKAHEATIKVLKNSQDRVIELEGIERQLKEQIAAGGMSPEDKAKVEKLNRILSLTKELNQLTQ